MKAGEDGRPRGPVLVFARPDDPVTMGFSQYASECGLQTWQPKRLDDVAWSYNLNSDVEVYDLASRQRWQSRELAGIWYQSWPPLAALQDLGKRDRRYVSAELNSSMRVICNEARCVVIGQAQTDVSIIDFGLESRVELRRLGLPALTDQVGSLQSLRATLGASGQEDVWVTRSQGASTWLSEILAVSGSESELDSFGDELMAATVTDNRQACVALHVDNDVLLVGMDGDTVLGTSLQDEYAAEIESIVHSLRTLTGARVGVTYLARQQEHWMIARLSLQIPYWLNDKVAFWLFPRLVNIFASSNRDRSDAGLM